VQRLEICYQIGAVEDAVAEVAGERGQPSAAQQPAEITHWVFAVNAGPIGEWRSGEHDRADPLRVHRGHHHDLPARLAVADQTRLAIGVRVALGHFLDKTGFGLADVLDRLTRHRLGQKADEIAGMTRGERHPDLAVGFHAADARAVPGARVEHNERPLARVDRGAFGGRDAHQPVIHRARQRAPI
jgi:hypothetical protein